MVRPIDNVFHCNQGQGHGQQLIETVGLNLCVHHSSRVPPNRRVQLHTDMENPIVNQLRPIYQTNQMFRLILRLDGHPRGRPC